MSSAVALYISGRLVEMCEVEGLEVYWTRID